MQIPSRDIQSTDGSMHGKSALLLIDDLERLKQHKGR